MKIWQYSAYIFADEVSLHALPLAEKIIIILYFSP